MTIQEQIRKSLNFREPLFLILLIALALAVVFSVNSTLQNDAAELPFSQSNPGFAFDSGGGFPGAVATEFPALDPTATEAIEPIATEVICVTWPDTPSEEFEGWFERGAFLDYHIALYALFDKDVGIIEDLRSGVMPCDVREYIEGLWGDMATSDIPGDEFYDPALGIIIYCENCNGPDYAVLFPQHLKLERTEWEACLIYEVLTLHSYGPDTGLTVEQSYASVASWLVEEKGTTGLYCPNFDQESSDYQILLNLYQISGITLRTD